MENHMLGHNIEINNLKRDENEYVLKHKEVKLETDLKNERNSKLWKINYTLLSALWLKEEFITRIIRKHFELRMKLHKNKKFGKVANGIFRGKFLDLNACIRKDNFKSITFYL